MEADVAFLRGLGTLGLLAWGFTGWTTLRYMAKANGHRPLIIALLMLSFLSMVITFGLGWTMWQRVDHIRDGWGTWSLYTNRIAVLCEAGVVWWTGRSIMGSKP